MALLQFEPEEYRYLLDEYEITDEEKDEFLRVLWNILATFVDIGFGLDSVQLATGVGKNFAGQDSGKRIARDDPSGVFNQAAQEEQRS